MATRTHELIFETPRRNEGQIVTYSYALTKSGARITRRHDGEGGSVHYSWDSGRRLTEAELARYGLIERG